MHRPISIWPAKQTINRLTKDLLVISVYFRFKAGSSAWDADYCYRRSRRLSVSLSASQSVCLSRGQLGERTVSEQFLNGSSAHGRPFQCHGARTVCAGSFGAAFVKSLWHLVGCRYQYWTWKDSSAKSPLCVEWDVGPKLDLIIGLLLLLPCGPGVINWPTKMWGQRPTILMVRVVRMSVTREYPRN